MKSSVFMERLRKKFSPAPTTIPARCSSLNFTMKKYWIKYRNRALPAIEWLSLIHIYTMPAFEKAVEKEYGIELDVQLTKDKIPVVVHDYDLKRVAGTACRIEDLSLIHI